MTFKTLYFWVEFDRSGEHHSLTIPASVPFDPEDKTQLEWAAWQLGFHARTVQYLGSRHYVIKNCPLLREMAVALAEKHVRQSTPWCGNAAEQNLDELADVYLEAVRCA